MVQHSVAVDVIGPWNLARCLDFWKGFVPGKVGPGSGSSALRSVFLVEADWTRAETVVRQEGSVATITVSGSGDLDAAAEQVCRFLALDIDAVGWPDVGVRDPVIAQAQAALPGLRPCGFHSPYEAAVWAVLSQRISMIQAARLRERLIADFGDAGALPTPDRLLSSHLELPGRKAEYLQAVADAALAGQLDTMTLRAKDVPSAVESVRKIKGLGPFSAELVVLRGANAPDGLPSRERRLDALIAEHYGADRPLEVIAEPWRPFRTWAVFHLRALGSAA